MSAEKFIWNHEDVNFSTPFLKEPTKNIKIPTEDYMANYKPKFQKIKFRRNRPKSLTNSFENGTY